MRHIIYNIIALASLVAASCLSAKAQVYVGYCSDDVAPTGLGNTNASATISCAAGMAQDGVLQPYQICDMTQLRVGLSTTEGLTSFKVWIREHLGSDNLTEVEVPVDELTAGWNTFELPMSFDISAYDTLYCGYDYTQSKKNVKAISSAGPKNTPNSFWIANNGKWRDYTSGNAPVSIQAAVKPRYENALRMNWAKLDLRSQLFDPNGEYERIGIEVNFTNMGSNEHPLFDIHNLDNGIDDLVVQYDYPSLEFGEELTMHYWLTPGHGVTAPASDIPIVISVDGLCNDSSALLINCRDTLYYELGGESSMPDMGEYLIEEFTSEECGYAPIGQQRLREAIEEAHRIRLGDQYQAWLDGGLDGYYTHYEILSRHEGYGPADAWRVSQGSDYKPEFFGQDKLTFAPAMMVNRKRLPISTTRSVEELAETILACHKTTPVTLADTDIQYDADTRTLRVKATVWFWSMAFCRSPRLMLCVKQDEVTSRNQKNYYPESYNADRQLDVVRLYLGSCDLYETTEMDRILSGQARIADLVDVDEYGQYYRTYTFEGTLPDDITSLQGLNLVGYVYDQQDGGEIYSSTTRSLH